MKNRFAVCGKVSQVFVADSLSLRNDLRRRYPFGIPHGMGAKDSKESPHFVGAPLEYGPVAQLVRAPPCHGGGHGFESRLGRFFIF